MANYGYETLQQMSAHPWEGLKPAQRKAVRGWNKKEGVPEPDMLEAERLLETNPNMSMDEALWKVTSPAYKAASADTKERIAELRKATKTESKPAKTAKTPSAKKDVAELVGEALNPKPADGVTGPDWQWLDQLPGRPRARAFAGRLHCVGHGDARQSRHVDEDARIRALRLEAWPSGGACVGEPRELRRHPVDAPEGLLRGRVPHLGGWLLGLLRTLRGTG